MLTQLDHLAKLSLLRLPEEPGQLSQLREDVEKILHFARRVQSAAATLAADEKNSPAIWQGGVPLTLAASSSLPKASDLPDECSTLHLLRDDTVRDCVDRDFLLENCPEHEHGYISVPKSIER